MAESTTARLGLPRWSADTDTPSRTEFDGAMAQLEANAAMYAQGLRTARPAAGKAGRFYKVVGDSALLNGVSYYDDGTAWTVVGGNLEEVVARSVAVGNIPLIAKGFTGQTANLQQWRKSDDTVVAFVDKDGRGTFSALSVLDDLSVTDQLTVGGTSALQALSVTSLQSSGTAQLNSIRSTAMRADGATPKTQIDLDGTFRADGLIPPGTIALSAATVQPAGWLFCDGSAVSRTTFAELFAKIGTTWGAGDGSTTFNIPDARDRFLLGAGTAKALGTNEGLALASRGARLAHVVAVSGTNAAVGDHRHTIASDSAPTSANAQLGGISTRINNDFTHNHGGQTGLDGGHGHTWSGGGSAPEHPEATFNVMIKT